MNTNKRKKSTISVHKSGKKPASNRPSARSRTETKTSSSSGRRRRRRISPQQRRRRQIRYLLQGLFLGFCICLLVFSIYKLASIFLGYRSGDKEYEKLQEEYVLEEPVSPEEVLSQAASSEGGEEGEGDDSNVLVPMTRIDLASLQEINSDAIGWIEIPDTVISYPLVHTSDNSYYLTHTFRKENNKSGSIFVETFNDGGFGDLHTIIYGHNMKNGSMFAGLKNYQTESYWEAHPYVYIDLADGSHCYQIFSCHTAQVTDISYTIGYAADDTYADFLSQLTAASLYDTGITVGIQDSVITLSTCTSNGELRFVVHAKKLY